jgi:hypothetical protein
VDTFGETAGQFLMRGFSTGMPLDVAGRLSAGNLLPGTGVLRKDVTDRSRDVAEVFGPAGSLVSSYAKAAGLALEGQLQGAVETAAPVAIANAIKGLDIAATGVYRDTRGRTVIESGPLDAPIKAIGFQPQPVAAEQRRLQSKQQTIALARVVESEIAGRWAEGIFEVDADKVQKAREQLATWNRKNPSTPIRIDMTQVLRRVRDMRATKAERLLRAAPRELRGALAE